MTVTYDKLPRPIVTDIDEDAVLDSSLQATMRYRDSR